MKTAIVIPARYASTRFPAKPLAPLRGASGHVKPLVQRSWEAARTVRGVDAVVVATDDQRIADAARAFGAEVVMTPQSCANGSERCAAAVATLADSVEIVVNFQGDAPLTPPHFVETLIAEMVANPALGAATPALRASPQLHRRLLAEQASGRVGGTTVVADSRHRALYFSKAVIPHVPAARMGDPTLPIFFHVGVYAYRCDALRRYAASPPSELELLEGLEQLRFLTEGEPMRVVEVSAEGADIWELNNPEDVPLVEAALAARGIT